MKPLESEVYSTTPAPWSTANPRNDHQLILPLTDGRLLLVWCEYYTGKPSRAFDHPYSGNPVGDAEPCRISAKVSRDGGGSWSDRITLQENFGVDNVKHPNLLRLPSGRILFSFTVRDIQNRDLKIYLKHSDDECESWSDVRQISPGTGVYFTNADHIFQHSTGRIILPTHAGPFYGSGDHWQAFCLYSDDTGETWHESRTKMDLPKRGAEEPAVVELKDESLFAVLRTSLGKLYESKSADRGESWSAPVSTGLDSPSSATCLKRIPGTGDLLLLWNNAVPYAHTPANSDSLHAPRNPLSCAVSRDERNS